jgi:hypothetical protein
MRRAGLWPGVPALGSLKRVATDQPPPLMRLLALSPLLLDLFLPDLDAARLPA